MKSKNLEELKHQTIENSQDLLESIIKKFIKETV